MLQPHALRPASWEERQPSCSSPAQLTKIMSLMRSIAATSVFPFPFPSTSIQRWLCSVRSPPGRPQALISCVPGLLPSCG